MGITHKTCIRQSFPAKVTCLKTGNFHKTQISSMR